MKTNGPLPINWFDILVVIVLFVGYARGKKHGMSKELLLVIKWVTMVLICAIAYEPLGLWMDSLLHIGNLTCFVLAYALIAGLIVAVFAGLKGSFGHKLAGSDSFGKGEFYLAMPAGMLRFACILIALLALLNARLYRTAEIKAMYKFQDENYGSQFFPTLSSLQADVFENSFTGPQIKKYMGFLLIKPTTPGPAGKSDTTAKRKEFTLP